MFVLVTRYGIKYNANTIIIDQNGAFSRACELQNYNLYFRIPKNKAN